MNQERANLLTMLAVVALPFLATQVIMLTIPGVDRNLAGERNLFVDAWKVAVTLWAIGTATFMAFEYAAGREHNEGLPYGRNLLLWAGGILVPPALVWAVLSHVE